MSRLSLACCLIVFFVSPVSAFDSHTYPYAGITLGTPLTSMNQLSDSSGSLNTDFNPGYMAGVTAGIAFNRDLGLNIKRIRAEAEIGYRSSELTKMKNNLGQSANMTGTVTVTNFMVNGYLENSSMVSNNLPLDLFLTIGVGGAMASISSISYQGTTLVNSASDTQLAYQGGLGAGYEITKKITLDASYKYMGTTNFKFGGIDAEYGSHNILLGARYSFK